MQRFLNLAGIDTSILWLPTPEPDGYRACHDTFFGGPPQALVDALEKIPAEAFVNNWICLVPSAVQAAKPTRPVIRIRRDPMKCVESAAQRQELWGWRTEGWDLMTGVDTGDYTQEQWDALGYSTRCAWLINLLDTMVEDFLENANGLDLFTFTLENATAEHEALAEWIEAPRTHIEFPHENARENPQALTPEQEANAWDIVGDDATRMGYER